MCCCRAKSAGSPTRFRASFPPFAAANSALPSHHVHEAASCSSGRRALGKQKRWSWQPIMFSAKESCSASTCRNFKIKKHWAFSSVRGSRPLIAPHRKHDAADGTIIPYCAVRISAVAYSRQSASGSGDCCSRSQSRSSRLEVVKSPGMIREAACVNS